MAELTLVTRAVREQVDAEAVPLVLPPLAFVARACESTSVFGPISAPFPLARG